MNYKECCNLHEEWVDNPAKAKIFLDGCWEDVFDIEEDTHRGWVCKTEKTIIELVDIPRCHIQI